MKHVLIIGGMGPQASVHAHRRLIDAAGRLGAQDNEDYPKVTHLSVNVPDFISNMDERDRARDMLLESLKGVDTASVTHAFIACNTAHILFDDIAGVVGAKRMVSLIDATFSKIQELGTDKSSVGLLATPSTVRSKLYEVGILPNQSEQEDAERIIRRLIANEDPVGVAKDLHEIVKNLKARGATRVILGCTELSMLYPYLEKRDLLDPVECAIDSIINA